MPVRTPPSSFEPIKSSAITWVIEAARARGNAVEVLAPWTKALVAHMRGELTPALKAEVAARWPELEYFSEPGTPHNEAAEGYIEGGFAVSFPREADRLPE